jgi:hypothetical protein
MRTTVNIDDHLLEQAKQRAAERRQSLGEYLEQAIRVETAGPARPPAEVSLPAVGAGGFRPGIDPTSNRSLLDAAEQDGFAR